MYDAWIMFASLDAGRRQLQIEFSYDASTSTIGKLQLASAACHFAGSDSALSASQRAEMPNAWFLPVLAGAVAIVFNLPDLVDLELRIPRETLAAIFLGRIRQWSELARWNPKLEGVNESIALVVPSGPSRASEALTGTLSSISSEWKGKVGTSSRPKWPGFAIRTKGDSGVALQLLRLPYSLGFMWQSEVKIFEMPRAAVENNAGVFTAPSTEFVQSAMNAFINDFKALGERGETMLVQSILDPKSQFDTGAASSAYPISVLTYVAFDADRLDCRLIRDMLYFVYWAWTSPTAAKVALAQGLSTVSSDLVDALFPLLSTVRSALGGSCEVNMRKPIEQILVAVGDKCAVGVPLRLGTLASVFSASFSCVAPAAAVLCLFKFSIKMILFLFQSASCAQAVIPRRTA